jgi:hypothetical protein
MHDTKRNLRFLAVRPKKWTEFHPNVAAASKIKPDFSFYSNELEMILASRKGKVETPLPHFRCDLTGGRTTSEPDPRVGFSSRRR